MKKTKKEIVNAVTYLTEMLLTGITENDKDCIRSNLEELTLFLNENELI